MQSYVIKISSKNKKSVEKITKYILNQKNLSINSALIKKTLKTKKIKKRKFTILKSPHVNKTAQEQFEYRIFQSKFLVSVQNGPRLIYFIKNLKKFNLPDCSLKITFLMQKNNKYIKNEILSANNFRINIFENNKIVFTKAKKKISYFFKSVRRCW